MENKNEDQRFMKIFGIYFALLMSFVIVRLASAYGLFLKLGDEITIDVVSTLIIQVGIMFLIPFFLYMAFFKKSPKQTFSDFKFKRIGLKAVLICCLLGILGYVINLYVSTFFSIILQNLGYSYGSGIGGGSAYDTLPKFLVGVGTVAILPATCEEFAHRGLIMNGTRKVWGYKTAIIVSSICFGLMHLNIQQFFFATILGVFMAYADISSGSIFPSIIMHFFNNFINVFLSYGQSAGFIQFSLSKLLNGIYSQSVVLFILFVSVILFLTIITFVYLLKILHKTSLQNRNKVALKYDMNNDFLVDASKESCESNLNIKTSKLQHKSLSEWAEEYVAPNDSKKLNVPFIEKIPFILCLFLGGLITVFTFIWGVI